MVLVSLLVQGSTVPVVARLLKVVVPSRHEPVDRVEVWVGRNETLDLLEYRVGRRSRAEGMQPDVFAEREAGPEARCAAVLRSGRTLPLNRATRLREGDAVWLIAPEEAAERLSEAFAPGEDNELSANAGFFGEFTVSADCLAGDLAAAYGLALDEGEAALPLASLVLRRLGRHAVEGDRVSVGAFELTVRHMNNRGEIDKIGLKLPHGQGSGVAFGIG